MSCSNQAALVAVSVRAPINFPYIVSAKATDAEVWEGWKAGADYYITKPFDPTELTAFIDHLLTDLSPDAAVLPVGAEA